MKKIKSKVKQLIYIIILREEIIEKPLKKLCPTCKTGAHLYSLDRKEPFCYHIECHSHDSCSHYRDINNAS